MVLGSVTPNFVEGRISSKEKIDIEMGNRLAEDSGNSLPEILRNLDYVDLEDELKTKQEAGTSFDPFFLDEQDVKKSVEISIAGDDIVRTEQSSASEKGVREFLQNDTTDDGMRSVQTSTPGNEADTTEKNVECCNSHPTIE